MFVFRKIVVREKCPNKQFFLVRIFLHSDWIQENTDHKKLHISTLFTQCFAYIPNRRAMSIESYDNHFLDVRTYYHLVLRKKCLYTALFWSVFSDIWTECGKLTTRITPNTDNFPAVWVKDIFLTKLFHQRN